MADRPMTTMSTVDVVELLLADHAKAKSLLDRFESIAATERSAYFCEVVTELVRHEVAEEHVVYPIIRHAPGGDQEADSRIAEESKTERLLSDMEKLDVSSSEFATRFIILREAVVDHASSEEASTFPRLKEMEDFESRVALGGRYEHAKFAAPTHPHPHAPDTPPGNLILGPVAALFDKARDAIRNA
jgi:hemerythrin superfamily protein